MSRPTLAGVPSAATIDELTSTFTATATRRGPAGPDADVLAGRGAGGAAIDGATGAFSWTPSEAQGPGDYPFTVRVSDGVTETDAAIWIHVTEINQPPVLNEIGNKSVMLGNLLTFVASASDSDLPQNNLTFSTVGAPAGSVINPVTGVFSWTPTVAQTGVHTFTVRVSDNGTPALQDSETISVSVLFGVCLHNDNTKSYREAVPIPLKISLCDASRNNVSSESILVQATTLVRVDSTASPFVAEDSGNANPDNNFRFVGGFYIFNLSLKSSAFQQGTWKLSFTVNGVADPSYVLTFDVK